ncbi:hypothetical protein [Arthrobacter sp. RAF14]|uniref:hypothetical protein n=1 Tax=Arthrobacter sp. RAF14 TaxID=3233051 RepID=UPI003F920EC5
MTLKTPVAGAELLALVHSVVDAHGLDWKPDTVLALWRAVYVECPINLRVQLLDAFTGSWSRELEAAMEGSVTRAMARSMAATERLWGRIEGEFGLFTADEAAARFHTSAGGWDVSLVDQGLAIGVVREGKLRFPGFQFDPETRQVRPVIRELISIGAQSKHDMEDLTLMMVSPSTYFEGGTRPVDHLDDPDLPGIIRNKLGVEW